MRSIAIREELTDEWKNRGVKEQKEYAQTVVDEYVRNFKRPGIESGKDLLWFGKLENHRYYNHHDPEVATICRQKNQPTAYGSFITAEKQIQSNENQGIRKRGERKEGEQMHVQIIVSRKDITNKIKLSPMNNSRGSNAEHSKKVGQFDRSAFKNSEERLFDEKFSFDRELTETFRYANTQKKGSLQERINLYFKTVKQEIQPSRQSVKEENLHIRIGIRKFK